MAIKLCSTGKQGEAQLTLSTFEEAVEEIKRMAEQTAEGERISVDMAIESGTYPIAAPVIFDAEASPTLRRVALTVHGEGEVLLTGIRYLKASDFRPVEGKPYYSLQLEKVNGEYPAFEDFFVDNRRIPMAKSEEMRHPFYYETPVKEDPANYVGLYLPERVLSVYRDAPAEAAQLMFYLEWYFKSIEIDYIDFDDVREKDGERYVRMHFKNDYMKFIAGNNGFLGIQNRQCHIINSEPFLTPNSFTYNPWTGVLLYYPADALEGHLLGYTTLENLMTFRRMRDLTFTDVIFTGVTTGYRIKNSYSSGQANNEGRVGRLPHAALITYDMENVTFERCSFSEIGCNGLLMKNSNTNVKIRSCRFKNLGMSALSVGNPSWLWEKPENRNVSVTIENNLVEDVGYSYPSAVALYVGMVDGLRLMHNTVRRCSYSGVSIGWGWEMVGYELGEGVNVRDAEVAYNLFEDFMDVLRDGAAIYVLGANCHESNGRRFNFMHDNFATLARRGDDSKRGYYMDGSASNWEVYRNVIDNCALPIFSQFHVPNQFTHHNYIYDIYSTTRIDPGNHAPWRDTILGACFVELDGLDALRAKYPAVDEIRAAAGCDLT